MLTTKRKPAGVGKILIEEFMEPMGLTQGALAEAMSVQRKHVNELCNDRRNMSEPQSHRKRRFTGSLSQPVRRLDPHQDRVAILAQIRERAPSIKVKRLAPKVA